MKTIKSFLKSLEPKIKKIFFIRTRPDSISETNKTRVEINIAGKGTEANIYEEYISRYTGTTRWQTV